MRQSDYFAWAGTGFDAWLLGCEAATVIGLRMLKIAGGNDIDGREARLMMTEKLQSVVELQMAMMTGGLGRSPLTGSKAVVRHYRRKVAANRRRLT